jgi:hypothetical protein
MVRRLAASTAAIAALALVPIATGSQLVDRNAEHVKLEVNAKGEAMLTYSAGGKLKHVLAWGAVNAVAPSADGKQVAFQLDYSGGYGKYKIASYWTKGDWSCLPYDGPPLAWVVTACKAPDGSYWAVQAWQRALPDWGVTPSADQSATEMHLSHWTGALPVLQISLDWSYHRFQHLWGTYTYNGVAEFGFKSTHAGQPLDTFGRNVYVDTLDSAYGSGWKRENSFLTHKPKGSFCYGFYAHAGHPPGVGTQYRATIIGPGVAPDVMWEGNALGAYNAAADATANTAEKALDDPSCKVN